MKKLLEFGKENGWYLVAEEIFQRLSSGIRGRMLGHKLGTEDLVVGPESRIRGLASMKVGHHFRAGRGLWLEAITRYNDQTFRPRISIGQSVAVSHWTHIAATNFVEIGDYCLFGSKVLVTDHNHGQYSRVHTSPQIPPILRNLDCDREVRIGSHVWLGDSVVVTPGATIGDGCVVGANSVVKGTLPPFTISWGSPARVVKVFDFNRQQWVNWQ